MMRFWNAPRWPLALVLSGVVSVTGCAGGSPFGLSWLGGGPDASQVAEHSDSGGSMSSASQSQLAQSSLPSEQASPTDAFGNDTSSWSTMWQGVSDAIAIKPRVVPANDPIKLSSRPENIEADVYVKAARLYEIRQDYQGASAQYQRALEINPTDLPALIGVARLHDRQGDFDAAAEAYGRAIAAHPKHALPHNDFGLCCARSGRLSQSLDALQQAVRLEPQRVLYRNNLAKVLVATGRPQEAFTHLAAVHPEGVAHFNLAFLLHERGDTPAARYHLVRATQVDPQLHAASEMLSQLDQQLVQSPSAPAAPPSAGSPGRGEFSFVSTGRPEPQDLAPPTVDPGSPQRFQIGDQAEFESGAGANGANLPRLLPPVDAR